MSSTEVMNTYTSESNVISSEQNSHTLTHVIESLGPLPCSYKHDPLQFYRMFLFLPDRKVPARHCSEFFIGLSEGYYHCDRLSSSCRRR